MQVGAERMQEVAGMEGAVDTEGVAGIAAALLLAEECRNNRIPSEPKAPWTSTAGKRCLESCLPFCRVTCFWRCLETQ